MFRLYGVFLGALLWSVVVQAVPYGSVDVGECIEGTTTRWVIWDTPPLPPSSLKNIVIQRGVNFPPPVPELLASPDPSGVTLFAVFSPDPSQRAWIDWEGRLMATSPTGLHQVGQCRVNLGFASRFIRPVAPPPPPMINSLVGFGIAGETPPTPNGPNPFSNSWSFRVPNTLGLEGTYTAPPVMLSKQIAEKCMQYRGRSDEFYSCIVDTATTEKQADAFKCAKESKSSEELALCLLEKNIGNNERAAVQAVRNCYAENGTDWSAYPICMAGQQLDPNIQRLISCSQQMAASGQVNYWALGTCAFGPQILAKLDPNPEAMIAIQCAVQSGGEPEVFVGCTAGQLAVRELDKCLEHGIGTDEGCFGPNNSLSNAYEQIGEGIATAFGKQSAAYLAWQVAAAQQDPRKAIEAFENVRRELNRAHASIGEAMQAGLEKVANAAQFVVPQITIKKPSGKIFGKKFSF